MEEKKKPNIVKRALLSYKKIPDKKPYIEFFAALLSIPVLLTVILLNLNSLTGNKDKPATSNTPQTVVVTVPAGSDNTPPNTTPQEECTPDIGPISIISPEDGEVVMDNPVFVSINYKQGAFCSVVWSYRINNGKWSDYDDRSIALYNPPPGSIKLELRVKSVVNNKTTTLTRNFSYQGNSIIQTTPVSSGSAN